MLVTLTGQISFQLFTSSHFVFLLCNVAEDRRFLSFTVCLIDESHAQLISLISSIIGFYINVQSLKFQKRIGLLLHTNGQHVICICTLADRAALFKYHFSSLTCYCLVNKKRCQKIPKISTQNINLTNSLAFQIKSNDFKKFNIEDIIMCQEVTFCFISSG